MTDFEPTVGRASWDKLGADLKDQRFTSAAALCEALGLGWTVRLGPLMNERTGKQAGRWREVIKEAGEEPTIGVVKGKYTPIQNVDFFGFLPQVCQETGLQVVTGGEVDEGSRIWVLTKAGELVFPDRVLPNGEKDRIEQHLLFMLSHDGGSSNRLAAIPHAFWCANALASAWRNAENRWSITHTKSAPRRLEEAMVSVTRALGWMDEFGEEMIALEAERFNSQQMRKYTEDLLTEVHGLITPKTAEELGCKANGDAKMDVSIENRKRRVDKIVSLFEGEGAACRGASKLDAYQAVTEFIDHHRTRARKARSDHAVQLTRFHDTVFGLNTQRFRERALRRLR